MSSMGNYCCSFIVFESLALSTRAVIADVHCVLSHRLKQMGNMKLDMKMKMKMKKTLLQQRQTVSRV